MTEYLDGLDAAEVPLPQDTRVLAALGPKMLELARTRTAGTHPYLVTPELTAKARAGIGPDGLVASEQGVVLETDPEKARATARLHLGGYLALPNYSNNWKRQGFTDDDLADGGSDRLVDALVVWGDEAAIAAAGPGAPRRRRRPRLHPGAHQRSDGLPRRAVASPRPRPHGLSPQRLVTDSTRQRRVTT